MNTGYSMLSPICSCDHFLVFIACCLAISGSYNSTIDFMAFKQQKFISHISTTWKSEIRVPKWQDSDESPLTDCRLLTSCIITWWKEEVSTLWVPFIRALIPFLRAPFSQPNTSQKCHLLISSYWRLGCQHINLGEHKRLVYNLQWSCTHIMSVQLI